MPVTFTRFDEDGQPIEAEHFTVAEASAMLHVSTSTIYARVRSEEWPAMRLTDRSVYLSKADINEIQDLSHQDGTRRVLAPEESTPPQLGTIVDVDETAPLE